MPSYCDDAIYLFMGILLCAAFFVRLAGCMLGLLVGWSLNILHDVPIFHINRSFFGVVKCGGFHWLFAYPVKILCAMWSVDKHKHFLHQFDTHKHACQNRVALLRMFGYQLNHSQDTTYSTLTQRQYIIITIHQSVFKSHAPTRY